MESVNLLKVYHEQTNIALFAKYRDRDGNTYIDENELEEICCDCRGQSYTCSDIVWRGICVGAVISGCATGTFCYGC